MDVVQLDGCCGVAEIQYLADETTPTSALREIASEFFTGSQGAGVGEWAHLIFTEVSNHAGKKQTYGADLAALIRKERLGTVTVSRAKINPNHRNPAHWIKVYTWAVDAKRFYKWVQANCPGFMNEDVAVYAHNDYYYW